MKTLNIHHQAKAIWLLLLLVSFIFSIPVKAQDTTYVRNVVLVHGAFVDGSGWQPVYEILTKKGYKVSVTQHTLTTFEEDVAAVKRIINQQDSPPYPGWP